MKTQDGKSIKKKPKKPKKPKKKASKKKVKGTSLSDAVQYLRKFASDVDNIEIQNYIDDRDPNRELRYLVYSPGKKPVWTRKADFRKKVIPGVFEKRNGKWYLLERLHRTPTIYRKKAIRSLQVISKERVTEGTRFERSLTGVTLHAAISKINIEIPEHSRLAIVATVTGDIGKRKGKTSTAFVEEFRSLPIGQSKLGMLHARLAREINKALHSRKWVFTTHREIEKIYNREMKALNGVFARYGGQFDDGWSIGRAKYELAVLAGYGGESTMYDRVQSRNVVAIALKSAKDLSDYKFFRDYRFLAEHYVNEGLLELTEYDQFRNVVLNIAISKIPDQREE